MKHSSLFWRITLIVLTLGNSSAVLAKDGWYAGFAFGSNNIDLDIPEATFETPGTVEITNTNGFDDNDLGFILNAGYRMNSTVALNFDFSYTYADARLGYTDTSNANQFREELIIESFYLTPGVHLFYPINQEFEIYGKLGLSFILSDITHSASGPSYDYTDHIKDWDIAPTIGFGGQWHLGENWAATFEYVITQFTIQPITGSEVSLSGTDFDNQNILIGMRYSY